MSRRTSGRAQGVSGFRIGAYLALWALIWVGLYFGYLEVKGNLLLSVTLSGFLALTLFRAILYLYHQFKETMAQE
jgi:hypothetical protein